ncbi:MAG: radical SAM protein [Butyrivibrio sp.]|nr:radical SAM protein [Butyrivibrio sp.]
MDKDYGQYIHDFIERFPMENEYIAYGAGNAFIAIREMYGNDLKIKYCVDMDYGKKVDGLEVYPPDHLKSHDEKLKIIITTNGGYADEIAGNLEAMGYDRSEYCHAQELVSVWGWFYQHRINTLFCAVVVGFACNLNCKGCSEYIGYHKSKEMLGFETVRDTIDNYFLTVDYVIQINVLGGETFISRDIGKICKYIEEKYGEHFHKMVIHTNGIVVPRDDVLESLSACKKLHIWISDYSGQINQKQKENISIFREKLRMYRIKHNDFSTFNQKETTEKWFDLGDPLVKKYESVSVLKERFSKCSGICFSLYKNKYYYCLMELSAVETQLYNGMKEQDYIDLSQIRELTKEEVAEKFLRFQLGFLEDGYLSFCDHCNGLGVGVNNQYIDAGIQ